MSRFNKTVLMIMGMALIFAIAVRHAAPIKDGDFFWHAAYAKHMVENKTLVPDHTIFSWTPADNSNIKCNWLAEILLLWMYRAGGLNLLFAFRYLCFILVFSILAVFAFKNEKEITPWHLFFISIALMASSGAGYIKPELFSFIFFSAIYFLYFKSKRDEDRGEYSNTLLYIPIVFLLWVNSHEVVLFGALTFASILLGETLNRFRRPSLRPSVKFRKHLGMAALGSLLAAFVNPYGYKLPLKLAAFLINRGGDSFGGIEAYHSIFFRNFSSLYFFDYWLIMFLSTVALTVWLAWKEKEIDWAIVLPTLFLSAIYIMYVRATYYWPVFWAFSMMYLGGRIKNFPNVFAAVKKIFSVLVCVLLVFLSSRIVDTAVRGPFLGQYFGFGAGYSNPVKECEFIKKFQPGARLYNSYGVGGYLTYALYPDYKVFIDQRYFPYITWYDTYYEFNNGAMRLDAFLEIFPFDVALVDYHYSKNAINEFLLEADWNLAFYGTAGAVFVKKETGFEIDPHAWDQGRFDELHSIFQAYTVFNFAQNIGDWESAEYIFSMMSEKFRYMKDYDHIIYFSTLSMKGMQAMRSGDYDSAYAFLDSYGLKPYMLTTNRELLKLRNRKVQQLMGTGDLGGALAVLEKTLSEMPEHLSSLFNAGVIGYMLERNILGNAAGSNRWRGYLEKFVARTENKQTSDFARMLLEGGSLTENIPLMF